MRMVLRRQKDGKYVYHGIIIVAVGEGNNCNNRALVREQTKHVSRVTGQAWANGANGFVATH